LADVSGEYRKEFIRDLLDKSYSPREVVNRVKVMQALCDGKTRLVTVPSATQQLLSPLHDTLYEHLGTLPWLLVGEAKPSCFSGFARKTKEVFVSGDYESATDNLKLDVASHILQCVLRRCSRVPVWVRDQALRSLQCTIVDPQGFEVWQRRGQLMGNYLCFPLLCLQNYLAFKYLVPRQGVPVKINGDDIVFRARPEEVSAWRSGVLSAGLRLSPGKTTINDRWFSLNSTFFTTTTFGPRLAPVVRSTHLFKPVENPTALQGKINAVADGMGKAQRGWWQLMVLRNFRSSVLRLQRSVRRGLECRVSRWVLERAHLWERECFYLSLPTEPPIPGVNIGYKQETVPAGWRRVLTSSEVDFQREACFFEIVAHRAWTEPFAHWREDAWSKARVGTFRCTSWLRFSRKFQKTALFLNAGCPAPIFGNEWRRPVRRGRKCWVQVSDQVVREEIDASQEKNVPRVRFPAVFPPPRFYELGGVRPEVEYPGYKEDPVLHERCADSVPAGSARGLWRMPILFRQ